MAIKKIRIRVPASSGNMGSGYDVMGAALDLYNEIDVERLPSGSESRIEVYGEGRGILPSDKRNLIWRAYRKVFEKRGNSVVPVCMVCRNRIPLARGLGSSSAAIVAGMLAGNAFSGFRLDKKQIFELAASLEGHPDNVAPSLWGGICISSCVNGNFMCVRWNHPKGVSALVCIPDFQLSTKKARQVLPQKVKLADAVWNMSRIALFLTGIKEGNLRLIGLGMEDKIHQPYRAKLVPGFQNVMRSAKKAGAVGVALSGAGPSILALAKSSHAQKIGSAMVGAFRREGIKSRFLKLRFDQKGATIKKL